MILALLETLKSSRALKTDHWKKFSDPADNYSSFLPQKFTFIVANLNISALRECFGPHTACTAMMEP